MSLSVYGMSSGGGCQRAIAAERLGYVRQSIPNLLDYCICQKGNIQNISNANTVVLLS